MSSTCAKSDAPAAWAHGLSPKILRRLRELINPLDDKPSTLAFNHERYERLYAAPPTLWGRVFDRYALFQSLRRREGETEAVHRVRQVCWLRIRRQQKRTLGLGDAQRPDQSTDLGTWIASPEELAASTLELLPRISPTARVFVIDIAADKDWLLAWISDSIDRERAAHGIFSLPRRGPNNLAAKKLARGKALFEEELDRKRKTAGLEPGPPYPELNWRPDPPNSELREFLRKVREHHIVPLWDLQLAGLASDKIATAKLLYPDLSDPAAPKRVARAAKSYPVLAAKGDLDISARSIARVLLQKIDRARELQDQAATLAPRLCATVR
jgi:hypothetical protein